METGFGEVLPAPLLLMLRNSPMSGSAAPVVRRLLSDGPWVEPPFFFLVAPTYYYYVVLLLPLLFFAGRLDRLSGLAGVAYLFCTGAAGFWLYARWDQYFPTTYWNAVLALGLACAMLLVALGPYGRRGEATAQKEKAHVVP